MVDKSENFESWGKSCYSFSGVMLQFFRGRVTVFQGLGFFTK